MNRSVSLFVAGLLVGLVFAFIGFAFFLHGNRDGAGAENRIVLKLGHGLDTAHPVHIAMVQMKRRLEELSGGRVTVDIYPGGVLGSEPQCIEQLQSGTLAMVKTSAASMENFIPEMAVFGMPYLFRDQEHYWKVLEGPVGTELLQKGRHRFLRGLCYYDAGSRNF